MDLGDAHLQPVRVLGEGTFGRVFLARCRDKPKGKNKRKEDYVCVKRIIVRNPRVELAMIKEEIYIISQLRHPNIVKFIRSFEHAGTVNIVMEYAPEGTLRDVIAECTSDGNLLAKRDILRYFCDMLLGIEYLHIRHVVHRDIKPENMLIDNRGRIKITDFGISAVLMPACRDFKAPLLGTPLYMAPEVMLTGKCDFKSDIWSLGCVLYELCAGWNPFATLASQLKGVPELHNVIHTLTHDKLDCRLILNRYGHVWSRLCEAMIVYDHTRRIELPDIFGLDAAIMFAAYKQYFDYKY